MYLPPNENSHSLHTGEFSTAFRRFFNFSTHRSEKNIFGFDPVSARPLNFVEEAKNVFFGMKCVKKKECPYFTSNTINVMKTILKQVNFLCNHLVNFINTFSFMIGKILYLSVIGRPILLMFIVILRTFYFIKIRILILLIRNGYIQDNFQEKSVIMTDTEYVETEILKFKNMVKKREQIMEKSSNEKTKDSYQKENTCDTIKDIWNENMDELFYKTEEYNNLMLSPNDLEKKWRNRTLIVNTSRGNIIMFFDCYKRGFSYYCDQNNIPYNILNTVAMRYVKAYLCLDLFVDNKIIKENNSPIIKIIEMEEKKENKKKREKFLKNMSFDEKKTNVVKGSYEKKRNPFIKSKKINGGEEQLSTNIIKQVNEAYSVNTFIYLGKTQNFSMLNFKEKEIKVNNNSINNKLSYSSYKNIMLS